MFGRNMKMKVIANKNIIFQYLPKATVMKIMKTCKIICA